jgi:hypothetical protein
MSKPLRRKHMDLTARWLYPSSGKIHAGYDYRADIGTPFFAVRGGTIRGFRDEIPDMDPDEDGESGMPANFVLLEILYKGRPATFVYLHIKQHSVQVELGETVEEGRQLGETGHNGNSSGPHLHVALMKGQRDNPFDYVSHLTDDSVQPEHGGVASNGINIFPPSVVYGRGAPGEDPTRGPDSTTEPPQIVVKELTFGTTDSDSVRHLQRRLNQIPLEHGIELPVTGNYLDMTRDEVTKWQVQKRHHKPGSQFADGNIHPRQARTLFGDKFEIVV